MAHYALLDNKNMVVNVIVGKDDESEDLYSEKTGHVAKRTSINTYGGEHIFGGEPFRKNYASIGYFYDPTRDAFIPPPEYKDLTLNEETCRWNNIAMPSEFVNNENILSWLWLIETNTFLVYLREDEFDIIGSYREWDGSNWIDTDKIYSIEDAKRRAQAARYFNDFIRNIITT